MASDIRFGHAVRCPTRSERTMESYEYMWPLSGRELMKLLLDLQRERERSERFGYRFPLTLRSGPRTHARHCHGAYKLSATIV